MQPESTTSQTALSTESGLVDIPPLVKESTSLRCPASPKAVVISPEASKTVLPALRCHFALKFWTNLENLLGYDSI